MTLDLDIVLFKFGKRTPWLALRNPDEARSAGYHIYSGFFWCLLAVALSRFSPWFLLIGAGWTAYVLWRELWAERHQEAIKTRTDILTKLIGLIGYLFLTF